MSAFKASDGDLISARYRAAKRAKTIVLCAIVSMFVARALAATYPSNTPTSQKATLVDTGSVPAARPVDNSHAASPTHTAPAPDTIPTNPSASSATASYIINWSSVNGGGTIGGSSPNYKMGSSAGQSAAGAASSANYRMGIGFWYGAGGCSCPHQGDMQLPNGSGAIDVNDVLAVIKIAFINGADVKDPECPKTRGDVNNSGVVDVNDVLYIIKTAFINGPNPVNPCGP